MVSNSTIGITYSCPTTTITSEIWRTIIWNSISTIYFFLPKKICSIANRDSHIESRVLTTQIHLRVFFTCRRTNICFTTYLFRGNHTLYWMISFVYIRNYSKLFIHSSASCLRFGYSVNTWCRNYQVLSSCIYRFCTTDCCPLVRSKTVSSFQCSSKFTESYLLFVYTF